MNAIERLSKELEYLHSFLDETPPVHEQTFEGFVRAKFKAMKLIKSKHQSLHEHLVTNKEMFKLKDLPPFKNIVIGYENENIEVKNLETSEFFYPASGLWQFYSSGQAAVNVTLLYLFEKFGRINLISHGQVYHETNHFYEYLSERTKAITNATDVLLVDSISWSLEKQNEFLNQIKSCKWILIDSTCWEMNSSEMDWLINTCKSAGVPFFIIRSHVKLDALGAEYGLLGSLLFVTSTLSENEQLNVMQRLKQITSMTRNAASYFSLYPFWKSGIRELVHERTRVLKSNGEHLAGLLKSHLQNGTVTSFPHRLFCYVDLRCTSNPLPTLRKYHAFDPDAFLICDSFGFDQITLLPLGFNDGTFRVRITSSTLDKTDLDKKAALLISSLNRLSADA